MRQMLRAVFFNAYLWAVILRTAVAAQPVSTPPMRGTHSQVFLELRERAKANGRPNILEPPKSPEASAIGDSFIGVNLWHMKLADSTAPVKMRGLKHKEVDPDGVRDWTPEHLMLNREVAEGDSLRVSIESARTGYLYVVDRDMYGNGSKSAPVLIFPTKRLHGGDNAVQPGRPVEIPDFMDKPPVFTVERTRSDQTAIELIVIVTPKPLSEIAIQKSEQRLSADQVGRWQKQWGTDIELTEDAAIVGKLYTPAEQLAASDPSRPLGHNDPPPMSLFHRKGHPGEAMFVSAAIKMAPAR